MMLITAKTHLQSVKTVHGVFNIWKCTPIRTPQRPLSNALVTNPEHLKHHHFISSHIVTRHHTQKHTCLMSAAVVPALAQFPGTFVKRTRQPAWHTAVTTGLAFRDNFLAAKPTISLLKVSFSPLYLLISINTSGSSVLEPLYASV